MKNLNFIILIILISKISFGQISDFTFESSKDYDNNVKIAYFHLIGFQDADEIYYVKKELLKNNDIIRFEIYKKETNSIANENSNYCMSEAISDYNESKIQFLINEKIQEYNKLKEEYSDNIWDLYKEIYKIPEDCPVFEYIPITKNNKEEFISKMREWKKSNIEEYKKIKHLKEKLDIPK